MYDETVSLKRISAMDGRASQTFSDVVPGGILCKIEHRGRRVVAEDGTEFETDATMMYKKSSAPDLRREDMVVRAGGEKFRVVEITSQRFLFSSAVYARADLAMVRNP